MLSFGPQSVAILNANASNFRNEDCRRALGSLPVKDVSCVQDNLNTDSNTASYVIVFNNFPLLPRENNLFSHTGNPGLDLFYCNTSKIDQQKAIGAYCDLEDVYAGKDLPGK